MLTKAMRRIRNRVLRAPGRQPNELSTEMATETRPIIDQAVLDDLATRDSWFHSHFVWAPGIVVEHLGRLARVESSKILDFGCGEGVMAKGVARVAREVHGVDLSPQFWRLEQRVAEAIGEPNGLPAVDLRVVDALKPLPYPDGAFDAAFAWSVFEHVDDVPRALREIHRVLRPGGAFFLTINPLYYSARGDHLWNVLDEPWIHLRLSQEELLERVRSATLSAEMGEGNTRIFQGTDPETFRQGLFICLESLNKITVGQLARDVRDAGFTIVFQETKQTLPHEPPADLLERYSRDDLMTDEVTMLMSR